VQLHRDIDQLHAKGAELHVIGNGGPSFLAGFRAETGYDGPLYTDPSLEVYRAAELKRGVARTFDPRALGKAVGALMHGHRQGRVQGDAWQQGGVVVIAPDSTIKWHYASERPDDRPTAAEIAATL